MVGQKNDGDHKLNQGGKYKEKCNNLILCFLFCDIFLFWEEYASLFQWLEWRMFLKSQPLGP